MYRFIILLATSAWITMPLAHGEIFASGNIPSDHVDALGETIGGIGSAIEWLGNGRVVMLSDRGPGDGTIDYRPRLEFFSMESRDGSFEFSLEKTLLLRDANGDPYTGLFPQSGATGLPTHQDGRECIDPEGLAVTSDGRFFISEEYGPSVLEFSAEGKCIRRFATPEECIPKLADNVDFGTDDVETLHGGREPNRGFEGLALMPDGKTLAAILQSGLVQDGGRDAGASRLYLFDIESGQPRSAFAVPFADLKELNSTTPPGKTIKAKHLAFSSLSALPDGRLLALERENFGADGSTKPDAARYKAVVVLDISKADNILGKELSPTIRPADRTTLCNLAEVGLTPSRMTRAEMPAKWEGITLLDNGRLGIRLLLSSDNDFLDPVLHLDQSGLKPLPFPKASRSQASWIVGLEFPLPPQKRDNTTVESSP